MATTQSEGIDLTTFAAGVIPPADLSHDIFNFPSSEDFPKLDMPLPQMAMEIHLLKRKLEWMEKQLLETLKLLSLMPL